MEKKIYIQDNGNCDFETVRDLLKEIEDSKKWSEENGCLEEFLNSKISIQLSDIEGQIVTGNANLTVGLCGDKFIITGNVQSLEFDISDK